MAHCTHFDFAWFRDNEYAPGDDGKNANHNMLLYHLVRQMSQPVVVECGSATGRSTCVLLTACEEVNGRLLSIDIDDCSGSATSPCWQFVQSDDRELTRILAQAPHVQQGIDLLFIDSVHTRAHVQRLLELWFPLVKQNGYIVFDDIDPTTYQMGGRTPHRERRLLYGDMAEMIREFYYANLDHLFLCYHFGISGRGVMKKISPLGTIPAPPVPVPDWPNPPGVTASLRLLSSAIRRYLQSRLPRIE